MTTVQTTGVDTTAALEVQGIRVTLGRREVLAGVDLVAPPGQWTTVIGPNGAGKTTLLRVIAGLQEADAGTVRVFDEDAGDLGVRERARAETVRLDEVRGFIEKYRNFGVAAERVGGTGEARPESRRNARFNW